MTVVAEDDRFLYLAKPAGLHTFGRDEPGLCEQLLQERPEQGAIDWPKGFSGGILHRLDGWTSGLIVAARDLPALEDGRAAFASYTLRKRYRFLTDRTVPWTSTVIEHELAHDKRRKARMVWRRGADTPHRGKWYPARTELTHVAGRQWEATITTGVMHQIRVHAASAGLPLAGDKLYGGGGDGRFWLHHRTIDGWIGDAPTLEREP
ncbi:MAG: RNA pseudouridine synthase [Proteobacteria bacterium]|nr:RNA pseudouridine synthase [Pseudomonadota bacterium]